MLKFKDTKLLLRFLLSDLARYVRAAFRKLCKSKSVEMFGVTFPIPCDASSALRWKLYKEAYERREAKIVLRRLSFGDKVLELGSGLGFISTLCTKTFRDVVCTTVEANPELIPLIRTMHDINNVSPEIVCGFASCERSDGRQFFIRENLLRSSANSGSHKKSIVVADVSVSELLESTQANFLIMDIEGGEEHVIMEVDLQQLNKLLIEFHLSLLGREKIKALIRHLENLGFREDRSVSTTSKKLFLKPPLPFTSRRHRLLGIP